MATDPVCGMAVEERPDSIQLSRENRTYYFCCTGCRDSFADPDAERARLVRRLRVAWPLAVAVLVLAYGLRSLDATIASAGLATIVQFYAGGPFYVGAWDALRRRIGNMDLLIATGTSAAYGYSALALVLPGRLPSEYFFDASTLIVTLILTGSYLELRTRARASSALRRLGDLLPTQARRMRGGIERAIPLAELEVGDRVRVAPGARFPADGVVATGRTSVDEALLTGESGPVPKVVGDPVIAGSFNRDGAVEVDVRRVGPDTFVAQVGALLGDAEMARVPLRRLADRIAAAFAPAVLALGVVAALGWHFLGGANLPTTLLVFVAVVITACPCAFGIATPAAILVGTGRAAEDGILFRGADAIERAARVDVVLTDKTGTLTAIEPALSGSFVVPPASEEELLAIAAGLSAGSGHPLALPVRRAADDRRIVPLPFESAEVDPGRGVRGTIGRGTAAILRPDVARQESVDLAPLSDWARATEARGDSWSVVVRDGRLVGALAFGSSLVPGAREAVARLRAEGVPVVLVTGDNEAAARRVARELGIDRVYASADPTAKVALVRQYRDAGHAVGFVGDGVNDAPALAAADAGFAIGSGTDVAREAGQILLVRPDFRAVPAAIGWARRTVLRVRGNLVWALAYNAVLLPIAAGALVPWLGLGIYQWLPVAGAIAMGLSSATVVLNSLTLRTGPAELRAAPPPVAGETVWRRPA